MVINAKFSNSYFKKVNIKLSAINVKEELQGTYIIYSVALQNLFCSFDWQREKNFSMADFWRP